MSSISAWVLSIAGIICLSVLVELIMPDGNMSKYIKMIFSFVIIFVIISPVPKLLNKELEINSIFQYEDFELQKDYLYQINIYKLEEIQNCIEDDILKCGYEEVNVSISADVFQEKLEFNAVYVDLSDLVISQNAMHKDIVDIQKDIKTIVLEYTNIKEEVIYFEK